MSTLAELEKLKRAYSRGVLQISHNGRTVQYGNADDLLKRIRVLEAELGVQRRPRSTLARFQRPT